MYHKYQEYTKEYLSELCKQSYSYSEVARKSGRVPAGSNIGLIKRKIKEYDIDISHFTGGRWQKSPHHANTPKGHHELYTQEEVLIKDSPMRQKGLRDFIKRHNLIEYKCQNCGCDGNWQNGVITLELDHINGDNTDNRLENLRYLCPNCHALTDTYRGKNKKKLQSQSSVEQHIPTT